MLACETCDAWTQFVEFVKERSSPIAFGNWIAPIRLVTASSDEVTLEVPNIFVQDYLLSNYKQDLCAFLPLKGAGEPSVTFVMAKAVAVQIEQAAPVVIEPVNAPDLKLNPQYRFQTFIEGPTNQFVKSAAMGVAARPGQSYNPLFIHGGVGLGKTHLLHAIGYHVQENHKKLRVHCITTEAFINDLVDNLRNKSIDRMKRFYRTDVDVLLMDDIQFLQNRLNFEEELCHTFETLINQNKQIVIISDKPPSQLRLSERMVARMEWGLVAQVGIPDLETRVAILQHKAEQRGLAIAPKVAFFIAERMLNNVRQLEGAVNRLSAHCRLLQAPVTEELAEKILRENFQQSTTHKISIEQILKSVSTIFQIRLSDLKSGGRTKDIALARQVGMFLANELMTESLTTLSAFFSRTHSTFHHACKAIEKRLTEDETLRRQLDMVRRNITA